MKTILKLNKMEIYLFIALIGAALFAIGAIGMTMISIRSMSSEKNIQTGEVIGTDGCKNEVIYKKDFIDMSHVIAKNTQVEINRPHGFTIADVLNKRVRYKNGDECVIVGSDNEMGLLNKWDNGNVSGFGRLEDIEKIIE